MNVLVFDIETVPDVATIRRQHDLGELDDASVVEAALKLRREQTSGSDFLAHYLHRIVAISVALRRDDQFQVWSLGTPESDEAELVRRFFEGVERYTPTLVSWNGGGFDLPVLHYRALLHGIAAPRYWDTGDRDNSMRFNNYRSRYHERHTDLMDVLAAYQPRACASLDGVATLLGLPGKLGMSGADVAGAVAAGRLDEVRAYCETDVMNTYLVYLRWLLIRGALTEADHATETRRAREWMAQSGRAPWAEFLAAWPETPTEA